MLRTQKFTVVDSEQKPFVGIIIGNVGGGLRILNLTDGSTTHYLLDDRGYLYEYKGGKVYGIYRATHWMYLWMMTL